MSLNNGSFCSTRWSLIMRASDENPETRRRALDELLAQYLPALRCHLAFRFRLSAEDAEDVVQEFVARKVLQRHIFMHADPGRGKFRSFVLSALQNFFRDWWRRQRAQRRGGGRVVASFDDGRSPEPLAEPTDDAFDLAWATQVLENAFAGFRAECEQSPEGRSLLELFEERLVRPCASDRPATSYSELVARLGFRSPSEASNKLTVAKRRFRHHVKSVILEYLKDESELHDELEELKRILSTPSALAEQMTGIARAISVLPDTDAASLLSPEVPHWKEDDFGAILQHQLVAPLEEIPTWSDVAEDEGSAGSRAAGAPDTMQRLFQDDAPSRFLLARVKEHAKVLRSDSTHALPHEVATVLYYLAVAVSTVRFNDTLSQQGTDALLDGLEWCCRRAWVPDDLRSILASARERLSSGAVGIAARVTAVHGGATETIEVEPDHEPKN